MVKSGEESDPVTGGSDVKKARGARNRNPRSGRRKKSPAAIGQLAKYPRHSLEKALRVPRSVLEQNAGKDCSDREAAQFAGVGYGGPFAVELSSSLKYGLLKRPSSGRVEVTDLARKILRPQNAKERVDSLRQATLSAPVISEVYNHYRGENLPDQQFLDNALTDTFHIPQEKLSEFKELFLETLKTAELVSEHEGKTRVLDIAQTPGAPSEAGGRIESLVRTVPVDPADTCFVMMPFGAPLGSYYGLIYEPAIRKAGLKPVRADADIFGTGKIMDQIWSGIRSAKVLIAEMTDRNPNVFYEPGLAHALEKPVVLVSSNEGDVPFDLQHIRVIYYDVRDPFWGQKLLDKVAENILSAIRNPSDTIAVRLGRN